MLADLQAPSQIPMERWLTGITALFEDQDLLGFETHQNIERIPIVTVAG